MRSIVAVAALVSVTACVSPDSYRRALKANEALQVEMDNLTAAQQALSSENAGLRARLEDVGKRAADADWVRDQKEKLGRLLAERPDAGAMGAQIPGVEVVRIDEGFAFRLMGGVLFSPGSIEISKQGKATLGQLVATLREQGKRVRIDGHTDDTPIQRSPWKTNLRLSAARSLAVADFLIAQGLDADLVGIAGYGQYRPTVAGSSDDARERNRRVEIVMLDQ